MLASIYTNSLKDASIPGLFITETLNALNLKKAFHRNEKLFSFQKGKYFKSICQSAMPRCSV
jgi:hypothetical protein